MDVVKTTKAVMEEFEVHAENVSLVTRLSGEQHLTFKVEGTLTLPVFLQLEKDLGVSLSLITIEPDYIEERWSDMTWEAYRWNEVTIPLGVVQS